MYTALNLNTNLFGWHQGYEAVAKRLTSCNCIFNSGIQTMTKPFPFPLEKNGRVRFAQQDP